MASLSLDDVPVELIETTVNLLDFQHLCALRLTAHNIAEKSSSGKFRKYLEPKKQRIAKAPLEEFSRCTQPGHMGCLLQKLTLQYNAVPNSEDSDGCCDVVNFLV